MSAEKGKGPKGRVTLNTLFTKFQSVQNDDEARAHCSEAWHAKTQMFIAPPARGDVHHLPLDRLAFGNFKSTDPVTEIERERERNMSSVRTCYSQENGKTAWKKGERGRNTSGVSSLEPRGWVDGEAKWWRVEGWRRNEAKRVHGEVRAFDFKYRQCVSKIYDDEKYEALNTDQRSMSHHSSVYLLLWQRQHRVNDDKRHRVTVGTVERLTLSASSYNLTWC